MKTVDFLLVYIVMLLPKFTLLADTVGTEILGIVSKVAVPLMEVEDKEAAEILPVADMVMLLEPSSW